METLLQDMRYGARMLWKNRAFTAVAVLALALGIGANSAIFSIVNTILLQPLPYDDPDGLVLLTESNAQIPNMSISLPNLRDWKEQNQVFEQIGAYRGASFNLTGGEQPERLSGQQAEAAVFSILGLEPIHGRTFASEEDRPGGARVALLSYGLWQRRFGGEPSIVGNSLTLNGDSYTVIGVMPPDLGVIADNTEVFVPFGQFTPELPQARGNHPGIYALARLKPGVGAEQARTEMAAIARRIGELEPSAAGNSVTVTPMHEALTSELRPALLVLLGVVGFVLLIACANVANLLLARAAAREKELAIRAALGAGRIRIARQLLTESVLLALAGGALGLLLAGWGTDLLVASLPENAPVFRKDDIGVDRWVVAFTFGVSILSALVFGLIPAFHASQSNPNDALKEGGRDSAGGSSRVRNGLVVAEVAIALVLLVGAGLMLKSFARLQEVDPGFDAENVLTMRIALPQTKYADRAQWTGFYRDLVARVSTLPGVQAAGVSNGIPLASGGSESGLVVEGQPPPKTPEEATLTLYNTVSPEYHRAMGVRLFRGRYFTEQDTEQTTPVAIIDDMMAERFWPDGDPVGKRIAFEFKGKSVEDSQPIWREVVGVVGHVRHYDMEQRVRVGLYTPVRQLPLWMQERRPSMGLAVRTSTDPAQMTAAVRGEVRALDRDLPVFGVSTMEQIVSTAVAQRRLSTWLLGIFAAVAIVLTVVGIYGVIAYSVAQRTHEIGVRMALGAEARDVMKMILKQGALLIAAGVAIGLAAAFLLSRLMASLLFGVGASDPATFVAVPLLLVGVALLACYIPARRATRVDPLVALRYE
jgi:predicted permease